MHEYEPSKPAKDIGSGTQLAPGYKNGSASSRNQVL